MRLAYYGLAVIYVLLFMLFVSGSYEPSDFFIGGIILLVALANYVMGKRASE